MRASWRLLGITALISYGSSLSDITIAEWRLPSLMASTQAAGPLQVYHKLDPNSVTVSGLSSGGFFAQQFHVAFSDLVHGAAVIAGGPYACAKQIPPVLSFNPWASTIVALGVCTYAGRASFDPWDLWLPERPSATESVDTTMAEHAAGTIDDPANLADDRVWMLTGALDDIVPEPTMAVVRSYYQSLGVAASALHWETDANASHGLPIEEFTGMSDFPPRACGDHDAPYVIDCDYDAAERLLRHLYPDGFSTEPAPPERSRLAAFEQTAFFDTAEPSTSLDQVGYIYVPADCSNDAASDQVCRLHIAFHGCSQYAGLIDDDFYWDGAYNRWAEANQIIVLYPQTTPWERSGDLTGFTGNPKGCWDWWGYSGENYLRRNGRQMQAVKAMIDQMLPD